MIIGKHILLVEDSIEDREKYATWLAAAGARVDEVETVKAARRALEKRRCDVIVADRRLPDGDAFAWLRAERERNSIPPYVVVSGYMDEQTYRMVYESGGVPLPKQHLIHPDVLIAAIGTAFRFSANVDGEREQGTLRTNPLLPAGRRDRNDDRDS